MSERNKNKLVSVSLLVCIIACSYIVIADLQAGAYQQKQFSNKLFKGAAIEAINLINEHEYEEAQYVLGVALKESGFQCTWYRENNTKYFVCEEP